ncbi:MAG: urease accessory protein UreF, partial [Pseudomonadota bacterium]
AFPVGAFAFSHGLETAISDGLVTDAGALEDWLSDLAEHGSLRSDVVLLSAAYAAPTPDKAQAAALAFQPSAERLEEAVQLGTAFCRTVRDVWDVDLPDLAYPVAVGYAAKLRGISLDDTAALYAQSFLGNLVSAAIRLMPLGQTEGQGVLARLQPHCRALGNEAAQLSLDDLASAAFLSDIQSMRHETQSPRIFQS